MVVALTKLPWTQNPHAGLGAVADWFVDGTNGSDSFDGQSQTHTLGTLHGPFQTMERLNDVLWPNGAYLLIQQDVTVHLAAGPGSTPATYSAPRPRCRCTAGDFFFLTFMGDISSSAEFTGTTFVNSSPTTPTRGEVSAAGATFVNQKRVRTTTGTQAGSIAYSSGLNGGATDTFVSEWVNTAGNMVNMTNGDHVVVDTLLVTIKSMDAVFNNYGDGAGLFIQDLIIGDTSGGVFNCSSESLRDGVTFYRCEFFSDTTSWSVGNALFVACAWKGSANFGQGFWRFGGTCVYQQIGGVTDRISFDHGANVQLEGGNLSDGQRLVFARAPFCEFIRSNTSLESLEYENGAGVSAALEFGQGTWWYVSNYPLWGVTGTYTVGIKLTAPSFGSFQQASPTLTIPSATNVTLNGQGYTFAQASGGMRVGACVIDNTAAEALDSPIVHLTAQAAAKALTNLYSFTPPAGTYLVGVEVEITTAGTLGTITPNAAGRGDGAASRTQSGNASGVITALGATSSLFVVRTDGTGNVQYGTTFNAVTVGSLQYSITAWSKRVGN